MVEVSGGTIKKYSGKIKPCYLRLVLDKFYCCLMRRLRLMLLFPYTLLVVAIAACTDNYDNYSDNPGDVLAFSTDTVAFDTILSTVTTPIAAFMVYNNNSKSLLISSVSLAQGDAGHFRVVVDGMAGTRFENIEIGAKDSIFVFVNVKLNENGGAEPVLYEDYVVFRTNGVEQKILLQAYGQDVYICKGKIFETSETLPNDKPYLIYDSLVVKEGVTLSIRQGTVFFMHQNSEIQVHGTLVAEGTREAGIVFRGDRMDNDYMVNIPYDRIPGQWGGFRFYETSFNNELDYVYIRNGLYGLSFDVSTTEQSKLKITNSVVTNVKGTLISATNCLIEATNCEFSNSRDDLLYLAGGKYSFTQCTMANYYPSIVQWGWGTSSNQTVELTNRMPVLDNTGNQVTYVPAPLEKADFINCIIYGSNSRGGIRLAKDTVNDPGTTYNYEFLNCLVLYDDKKSKDRFTDCVFNKDPRFLNTKLTDDKSKSIPYDFRIDSISPARNTAHVETARKFPYDINGVDRFADEGPDIGGYEYNKD
ncbi:MAG: hypothetical protein LBU57_05770 [Dysgonamonadaceae bacterium]|jgi:hypothetical protein|nr:hypothetical protein [Dysgonamonadaceae bacterium]